MIFSGLVAEEAGEMRATLSPLDNLFGFNNKLFINNQNLYLYINVYTLEEKNERKYLYLYGIKLIFENEYKITILNMTKKKPILLAPAGNWQMLNAVIERGADAIYFGIQNFNMRAQSESFTVDELDEIVQLCKSKNIQTNLTLNIILYDNELKEVENIISQAKEKGVDEIICWDPSVIQLCRKYSMPFCISTQASISNSSAASFYKDLGANRIVMARECSLEQVMDVIQNVDIEVETFVHGAMCIAVSGRCFMSHDLFNRSANRGDCIQPCRREYQVTDERKDYSMTMGSDYIMSSKDLCTIDFLDKLIDSGISVFKIEGRKRSPEYAAKVTEIYRKAIDLHSEGKLDVQAKIELNDELNKVFNRGFTSGFYNSQPRGDDFASVEGNASATKKEYIGDVINYYKNTKVAYVRIKGGELNTGDNILIIGKTSGVIELQVSEMIVEDKESTVAAKGSLVTFPCENLIRPRDKVYLLKSEEATK